LFEDVAAEGPRTPSVRSETLARQAKAYRSPVNICGEGREVGVELPPFEGGGRRRG
jgi:hypothetical protein